MLVKDFITKEIPVLKSSDKGKYALELMDDYKVRHLPWLVEDLGTYQALVSEKSLLAAADLSLTLAELNPADCWSVHPDALFPDAVDIMSRHNLSLLPVVGEKAEYQGVLTQEKAFQVLALYSQMESAGNRSHRLLRIGDCPDFGVEPRHIAKPFVHDPRTGRIFGGGAKNQSGRPFCCHTQL